MGVFRETPTQGKVSSLCLWSEAESCRAHCRDTQKVRASPSPRRCHGSLWVLGTPHEGKVDTET